MRRVVLLFLCLPGLALAEEVSRGNGVPVDTVGYAFKTLLALSLVVVLVLASAWAVRRLQGLAPAGAGRLKVVAALSVGSRERLVVVEVGGEQLLIGVAPGQVRALHVLREPLDGAASSDTPFPQRLRRALRKDEDHD